MELENNETKFKMFATLTTPLLVCKQFIVYNVTYILERDIPAPFINNEPNAYEKLMESVNKKFRPEKVTVNNNYDKLFNALISHLEENKLGWSNSIIVSTGIHSSSV